MSEYRSYTEQMTVLDGDSDFRRCLKPSALFRYVEQVSADHARAYGMDHAFFRERRSVFLVGKQALRVWRMPGRAEKINLTTACEAFKKGTMKRLTTITSETGEKLALVDCRWMIVDTEAGRILRTPGWTMPDFQNDDLPEELPQIVHKSQPLTAAGAPGQLLHVRPQRPHQQLPLSGHRLRRSAAGGRGGCAAVLRFHQVPP